jgi:hypothetical protein
MYITFSHVYYLYLYFSFFYYLGYNTTFDISLVNQMKELLTPITNHKKLTHRTHNPKQSNSNSNELQLQIWDMGMALDLPLLLSTAIVPLTFLRSTIIRFFFLSQILLFHLLINPKQFFFCCSVLSMF